MVIQTIAAVAIGVMVLGRLVAWVLRRRHSRFAEPLRLSSASWFYGAVGLILVAFAVGFADHGGPVGIAGAFVLGIAAVS